MGSKRRNGVLEQPSTNVDVYQELGTVSKVRNAAQDGRLSAGRQRQRKSEAR